MKVLLTGATGFLGGHVLKVLESEHDVRALVRRDPGGLGVEVLVGDVTDRASLDAAVQGVDAVIHSAGAVAHKQADAGLMQQVHGEGTRNLLDAARQAGVKRFVHVSSSGTVAVSSEPVVLDESAPDPMALVARWPYYRAKLFSERLVREASAPGFETVTLNPSLLLGPPSGPTARGRPGQDSSNKFVQLFLDGWIAASPPGGTSVVDVRDVAEQCARCLTVGRTGQRYLLGTTNWTFRELLDRLARVSGQKAPALGMPKVTRRVLDLFPELGKDEGLGLFNKKLDREDVELACHFWYLDDRKARTELRWSPRDPMETLADTVRELRGAA